MVVLSRASTKRRMEDFDLMISYPCVYLFTLQGKKLLYFLTCHVPTQTGAYNHEKGMDIGKLSLIGQHFKIPSLVLSTSLHFPCLIRGSFNVWFAGIQPRPILVYLLYFITMSCSCDWDTVESYDIPSIKSRHIADI